MSIKIYKMNIKPVLFKVILCVSFPIGTFLFTSCGPGTTIDPVDIEVTDDITSATTFTNRNSGVDYIVKGEVSIKNMLTIEPGTEIQFDNCASLLIEDGGGLNATGTASKPIIFTGKEKTKGFWKGIYYIGSNTVNNKLVYCTVEYGGCDDYLYHEANVVVGSNDYGAGRLTMSNTTIRNGLKDGLYISKGSYLDDISNCVITGNDYPVRMEVERSAFLKANTDYSGNDNDFVWVQGWCFGGTPMSVNLHWNKLNVPYTLKCELISAAEFSVENGTTVVMQEEAQIHGETGADFDFTGITFEGKEHTPGYWLGFYMEGGSIELNNCMIADAGHAGFWNDNFGSIYLLGSFGTPSLSATGCTIKNSYQHGIATDKLSFINADAGTVNTFQNIGMVQTGQNVFEF